jgi:hypothetical protein
MSTKNLTPEQKLTAYVDFAVTENLVRTGKLNLLHDRGLPRSAWTKAHAAAVDMIAESYGVEARAADARGRLEWSSGRTFEGGTKEQQALVRVCKLITGEGQKKMREQAAARAAFSKLDKGEKATARVEKAFADLEKLAGKEDLSDAAREAMVRHAKHILLLCAAK